MPTRSLSTFLLFNVRSLKNIRGAPPVFAEKEKIEQIMNDISGSNEEDQSLNLYEWMFLRSCADAWTLSAGNKDSIQKDQLLDIGMKVMPQYSLN